MARMPREPEAFGEQVAKILLRHFPEHKVELPGPLDLILNGRHLGLENLYRMVQQTPDRGVELVENYVDEVVSIGDYVVFGGEVAALVVIEAVTRLLPGVLGNADSLRDESHKAVGRVEYPQYTRPPVYEGHGVPSVLLSGNHAEIEKWRDSKRSTSR